MSLHQPNESHPADYVFVLWGDNFDEEVAIIFVTALRRAGLPVRVVGLTGPQAAGLHGVVIFADLTLGQALTLADQALGVVIPCDVSILQRIEDDPRLRDFLRRAVKPSVQLVVERPEVIVRTSLHDLTITTNQVAYYGETADLVNFAHTTAHLLATATAL